MSTLDLKSLSDQTIQLLGIEAQNLWMIKVGSEVFGPFETLSIKHYASENPDQFVAAQITLMNDLKWVPFLEVDTFKNIEFKQPEAEIIKEKMFWILVEGQISLPFTLKEINKKIELGKLSLTDSLSVDEGDNWQKIYHVEEFAHRLHDAKELPSAPTEANFNKAKIKLLEKMEVDSRKTNKKDISSMAYLGQRTTQIVVLKIDEISLETLEETEVSRSLRWAVPSALAGILTMVLSGYYIFTPSQDAPLFVDDSTDKPFYARPMAAGVQAAPAMRQPSSVAPMNHHPGRSSLTQPSYSDSVYPTHIETHHDIQENDPQHEQIFDNQEVAPQPEEQVMVGNPDDGQSLDAAMNGVAQPVTEVVPSQEQPIIEEVSDF